MTPVNEISVAELAKKHTAGEDFILLDVREPDELEAASIGWAKAIPMGDVPVRIDELPKDKPSALRWQEAKRAALGEIVKAKQFDVAPIKFASR